MKNEIEVRIAEEMLNIGIGTGKKVVTAKDNMAIIE